MKELDINEDELCFVSELWKRSDILRRWNLRYFELDNDGILRFYRKYTFVSKIKRFRI